MTWRTVARNSLFVVLAFGLIAGFAAWRNVVNYPFGRSHCCDKALRFALENYAETHGGEFPTGEASPEASLSLLYKAGLADANLLRGKSVPESTVEEILTNGKLLGPESCGWHYVEGLRKGDDGRIAIFWDKAGLGHNGNLLADGGHIVWYLNFDHPHIPAAEWPKFLAEQKELHDQRGQLQTELNNGDR